MLPCSQFLSQRCPQFVIRCFITPQVVQILPYSSTVLGSFFEPHVSSQFQQWVWRETVLLNWEWSLKTSSIQLLKSYWAPNSTLTSFGLFLSTIYLTKCNIPQCILLVYVWGFPFWLKGRNAHSDTIHITLMWTSKTSQLSHILELFLYLHWLQREGRWFAQTTKVRLDESTPLVTVEQEKDEGKEQGRMAKEGSRALASVKTARLHSELQWLPLYPHLHSSVSLSGLFVVFFSFASFYFLLNISC